MICVDRWSATAGLSSTGGVDSFSRAAGGMPAVPWRVFRERLSLLLQEPEARRGKGAGRGGHESGRGHRELPGGDRRDAGGDVSYVAGKSRGQPGGLGVA